MFWRGIMTVRYYRGVKIYKEAKQVNKTIRPNNKFIYRGVAYNK